MAHRTPKCQRIIFEGLYCDNVAEFTTTKPTALYDCRDLNGRRLKIHIKVCAGCLGRFFGYNPDNLPYHWKRIDNAA